MIKANSQKKGALMDEKTRLEKLEQRKAKIEQDIQNLKAKETQKKRKEETRLKVLIGAAFLADGKKKADVQKIIKQVLARGITAKRDRDFLIALGWIEEKGQ